MKRRFLKLGVLALTALSCVGLTSCDFSFGNSSNTSEEEIEYTKLTLICTSSDNLINFTTTAYLEKGKRWQGIYPEFDDYKFDGWYTDKARQSPLISLKTRADGKILYGFFKKIENDNLEDNTNDDNSNSDNSGNNTTDSNNEIDLAKFKSDCYKYIHLDKKQNKKIMIEYSNGDQMRVLISNARTSVATGLWINFYGKDILESKQTLQYLTSKKMYYTVETNNTTKKYYKDSDSNIFDSFFDDTNSQYYNVLFPLLDYFTFEKGGTIYEYKASVTFTAVNEKTLVPDSNGKYTATFEFKNKILKTTVITDDDTYSYIYSIPDYIYDSLKENEYTKVS